MASLACDLLSRRSVDLGGLNAVGKARNSVVRPNGFIELGRALGKGPPAASLQHEADLLREMAPVLGWVLDEVPVVGVAAIEAALTAKAGQAAEALPALRQIAPHLVTREVGVDLLNGGEGGGVGDNRRVGLQVGDGGEDRAEVGGSRRGRRHGLLNGV